MESTHSIEEKYRELLSRSFEYRELGCRTEGFERTAEVNINTIAIANGETWEETARRFLEMSIRCALSFDEVAERCISADPRWKKHAPDMYFDEPWSRIKGERTFYHHMDVHEFLSAHRDDEGPIIVKISHGRFLCAIGGKAVGNIQDNWERAMPLCARGSI